MAGRDLLSTQQPQRTSLLREGGSLSATRLLLSPTNPDPGLEAKCNEVRPKPECADIDLQNPFASP